MLEAARLKRRHEPGVGEEQEEEHEWRPPKRVSPFLNTPKQRKDEKRKMLRLSVNKLKQIDNVELCLRRAVLLHNTILVLQRQLRDDKRQPYWCTTGTTPPSSPPQSSSCLFDPLPRAPIDDDMRSNNRVGLLPAALHVENRILLAPPPLPLLAPPAAAAHHLEKAAVLQSSFERQQALCTLCERQLRVPCDVCTLTSSNIADALLAERRPLDMRIKAAAATTPVAEEELSPQSHAPLSKSIGRAMNCVQGAAGGECFETARLLEEPPSCLSGHTGYFSMLPSSSSSSASDVMPHTCSEEAFSPQTLLPSSTGLSPFLSLLDEPWTTTAPSRTEGANDKKRL